MENNKVTIFLDIDGVLNNNGGMYYNGVHYSPKIITMFQQTIIDYFEDLIEIVVFGGGVSSKESFLDFVTMMGCLGVRNTSIFTWYIEKVKAFHEINSGNPKKNLIQEYLDSKNINRLNGIIIEDEPKSASIYGINVYKVSSETGLTIHDIHKLCDFITSRCTINHTCPICKTPASRISRVHEFVECRFAFPNNGISEVKIPYILSFHCNTCSDSFTPIPIERKLLMIKDAFTTKCYNPNKYLLDA